MVYTAFWPISFVVIDARKIEEPEIDGFRAILGGFELTQMANKFQN